VFEFCEFTGGEVLDLAVTPAELVVTPAAAPATIATVTAPCTSNAKKTKICGCVETSRHVSIDVEAAATGYGHNDRAPCWVAVVNEQGVELLNRKILVPGCVSALTAISGVTVQQLEEEGLPFDHVRDEVISLLGPDVVLVGQSIQNDIDWMQLEEGRHFKASIDLMQVFKSFNKKHDGWTIFGLAAEAYALLGKTIQAPGQPHDPAVDASISMELFREWVEPGDTRQNIAVQRLKQMATRKEFPPKAPKMFSLDGVCMTKNPERCSCGQHCNNDWKPK
jgi:hypothetical protein